MRTLISLIILLSITASTYGQSSLPLTGAGAGKASGAGNTWTTSSGWAAAGTTSASLTCNPNPCTAVTVPATVAGDLLFISSFGPSGNNYAPASISAGGTLVVSANCSTNTGPSGSIGCGWVLSATGGVTSIAVTMNIVATGIVLNFRSYHPSSTTAVAETVPAATNNASCSNNCVTPTVTLTSSSDLLIAFGIFGNTGCSAASPYGNTATPNSGLIADRFNTSSGTGATFTQGTACPTAAAGDAIMSTVAFK